MHAYSTNAEDPCTCHMSTCTQFTVHSVDFCPHSTYSPCSNVIILSTPAPVLVREAIHLHVLVWGHCRHPTKVLWVWKPGRVKPPMCSLENNVSAQYIYMKVHPRAHTHHASTCIWTCPWPQTGVWGTVCGRCKCCGRSQAAGRHHAGRCSSSLHLWGPPAHQHSAAWLG